MAPHIRRNFRGHVMKSSPLMHEGTDSQPEGWDHFGPAYQLFMLQLIIVAKLQLWVIKINLIFGVTPVWRIALKSWSISKVENHCWRRQRSGMLLIHMVHGTSSSVENYLLQNILYPVLRKLMTAQRLLLFLILFKRKPQKYLSICKS